MTTSSPEYSLESTENNKLLLGGYAALAQSAWMGFVQATEVLDQLRTAPAALLRRQQIVIPRWPRIQWKGLYTREFGIAEASFILMLSFFLSAALGAIRQILFNAQFGVGLEANAYYAAFRLPDTLFSLVAGGALSSAMIPVLLNTRRTAGEASGWQLVNSVATTIVAFFALLVLVVELFTPFFVTHLLAPGFDAATRQLTITLTRIMLLQAVVLALGSVATAVLNSRNQFFPTALSVVSHNVTLIAGILAAKIYPGLGIYGPTFGVLGGALLQALILTPGLRSGGQRLQLTWHWADRRLREVIRLLIPNGLSVGVNYSGFIIDTAFATQAPEQAGLAALYNAFLLVGLPIALLGQAVGQAAFPRLTAHAENAEWAAMRRTLLQTLGAVVALAIPAIIGLLWLGRPVIHILFERGKFDAAAGDLTYQVLVIYAVALPAYVATEVITRGLIALRDTRTPLATNSAQIVARIVIILLLLHPIGVLAMPTAFAVSATLETIALGVILWVKLQQRLPARRMAATLTQ